MASATCSILLFHFYITTTIILIIINPASSECHKSFDCGDLGRLEFPFSNKTECGLFLVSCNSSPPTVQFGGAGGPFLEVLAKNSTNSFQVRDPHLESLLKRKSCDSFRIVSLPDTPLTSFTYTPNITLLSCSNNLTHEIMSAGHNTHKKCSYNYCDSYNFYYCPDSFPIDTTSIPFQCSSFQMPAANPISSYTDGLFPLLSATFQLEWNVSNNCLSCHHRGGRCHIDDTSNEFWCEGAEPTYKPTKIIIVSVSVVIVLTSSIIITFLVIWRKIKLHNLLILRKGMTQTQNAVALFLNNHGNIHTRRYKYSDLKKITSSFTHELGRGGFGCVYKGKLPDDQRLVAVKILSKLTEGGEEFMNEVASISRTSHVNIVTLLGYCIEGSKRALIYEFMPNGSLEKFIQHKTRLDWGKLFNIAIGTARGLEYLHQGCNMRILHFDIKPHNILLDKDFTPKISDFGLAKLCPNRSSLVSMLTERGTIGYIAPEVFCRNFGGVSHKSDVYSYGMMVIEMALGREKVDRRVDESSEMYFPDWIYKSLEENSGIGFVESVKNEEERNFGRKMIIVGLWCIQTDPRNRPSMSRVVEMLGGSVDCLEVPPMPYLALPPLPPPDDSSANVIEGLSSIGSL